MNITHRGETVSLETEEQLLTYLSGSASGGPPAPVFELNQVPDNTEQEIDTEADGDRCTA